MALTQSHLCCLGQSLSYSLQLLVKNFSLLETLSANPLIFNRWALLPCAQSVFQTHQDVSLLKQEVSLPKALHSTLSFPLLLPSQQHNSTLFSPAHDIQFQPLDATRKDLFLSQNCTNCKGAATIDSGSSWNYLRIYWMLDWYKSNKEHKHETGSSTR
jgi:hypothetical protein